MEILIEEISDKIRIKQSIKWPLIFVVLMAIVKIIEYLTNSDFGSYGLFPMSFTGLRGIVLAPFLHADFNHLWSNVIPIFILGTALFYFYKEIAKEIFIVIYIATGLWTWVFARSAYHIGASGILYALASFLFFSGIIRKERKLAAISMLVAFLYGSIFWGIFPLKPEISWESHLMGFVAGILAALYYRKEGPQQVKYAWELEEEEEETEEEEDIQYKEYEQIRRVENNEITPNQNNMSGTYPEGMRIVYRKPED